MNVTYTIPQNPHIDGVYSYYTGLAKELQNKVQLKEVELNSYFGFAGYVDSTYRAAIYNSDLIHNPTSYYYLVRKQPIPVVITIMDAIPFLKPEMLSTESKLYHKYIGLPTIKKADHIITISEYSKKDLIKIGIPEEKLTVIYPGINPIFFTQTPHTREDVYKLTGTTDPYVLYVGGFNPRKNVERLIITFMGAKKKYKFNYKLFLAGGHGWDNSFVYELAKRFHEDVVIVRGPTVEQIHALYTYASLFVYPSLYEGFGLPIAEAMACGCPVMCSDRTSIPEVVGHAGITFNPMQIPHELFEHIDRLGTGMLKEQAKQFNWQDAAKKTIEVYKKVLE